MDINKDKLNGRYGQGKGLFLVPLMGAQEFTGALEYACHFAKAQDCHVALLRIIDTVHVAGWRDIEKLVQKEERETAEEMLWSAAGRVLELTGKYPALYIEEGEVSDAIVRTIKSDKQISALVLAPATSASKPGPLVKYFSRKGLARLSVPVIIAPTKTERPLHNPPQLP